MRILFYISIFIPIIAFGQKINTQDVLNPHPLDMRKSKASFHTIHLGSSDTKDVEKYLKNNISNLKNSSHTSLKLLHNIESPGGIHLTYRQLFNSIPIYASQVKVNLNKEGHIKSIFDNSFITTGKLANDFPDESIVSAYLNNIRLLKSGKTENIYFSNDGLFIPAVKLEISKGDHSYYEVIIDNKGKVLYQKDLNRYFRPFFQDSLVSASIFMPDPLTTAGVTYGSPYIDASDSNVLVLNAERVSVNITVDFTNDTFRLISPFIKIEELSSPSTTETYSTSPSFNYTRSQQEFEDVNVYYHINVFQQYIQSLGFTNLVNAQIKVDAHALNDQDNSIYNPGNPGSLLFGEGGVDDAEDADVIIHEYGHAILTSAAPGTWSGFERQALEEGLGDYLATSYSRDINPFNWQDMFSWDGHNSFWNGRTATSTKLYPTNLGGNIHLAGEIWSSALMQIWEDIGRTTTDQILLQSLYSYATGMTMTDAAYLFLEADSLLNGGVNYCVIYQRFEDRGFLPPIPFLCAYISSSSDVTCNGNCDGISIVNTKGGTPPFSYLWDDSLSQTTASATGLCPGFYIVKITDSVGDTAFSAVVINETIVNSGFTSTIFVSGRVTFKNTSTGATDWYWTFGDGNTSISENPIYIYDSVGTYDVMLIASVGGNCADTSWGSIAILYTSVPIGIDEPDGIGSLSLFPNPTPGKFKVQFDTKAPQALSIRIYNMIGQIVDKVDESGGLKKESYVFDISNQAKGIYILNIQTPFKTTNFKLIKF